MTGVTDPRGSVRRPGGIGTLAIIGVEFGTGELVVDFGGGVVVSRV